MGAENLMIVMQVVLYIVGAIVWNLFSTGERVFD